MPSLRRSAILLCTALALAAHPLRLRGQALVPATAPASAPTTGDSAVSVMRPAVTNPTTQISLNFKDAPVDAVLEHLSDVAGFIVVKEAPVDGRVTVLSKQPVSPAEAVTLLNTVLKVNGYTAIQMGRILKIVAREKAKKGSIPVHFGAVPGQIEPTDDLITQVIPVRSVDAVKLRQDLQPLVGPDADVTANGGSNTIVMTDTAANIRRIVEVISTMDKRDALENGIKVRQLKFADATQAAKLVMDIFGPQNQPGQNLNLTQFPFFRAFSGGAAGGGQGRGAGGFGGAGFGGQGASAQGQSEQGQTGRIQASADVRTNTVVVAGPSDTLRVIDSMLQELDTNPSAEQTFFIYRVRNGQAVDMQNTLNSLFGATGTSNVNNRGAYGSTANNRVSSNRGVSGSSNSSAFGRTGGGGGSFGAGGGAGMGTGLGGFGGGSQAARPFNTGQGGGAVNVPGAMSNVAADLAGQVLVVADQNTNSLLIAAASKFEDRVKAIVTELDRPVPQVLIKVLIAEVTHNNSDDLGTDFSILNLRASGRGQAGVSTLGNVAANAASGGLAITFLEEHLAATFHALATAGKLDVLSRPYILASDNQVASIVVGQEVPIITDSRVDINNNPVNQITYRDIGIILNVTPHINPDGLVICDVSPEVSSISDQTVPISSTVRAPVFNLRSADSRVGIRNGETIVIGGMMQDQKTQTVNKIPILGDIPGLNLLFARTQVTKTKTELLIFLTPHVAPQPEKVQGMSNDEMRGIKLVPSAVQPGTFQEHMRGLDRGATTKPSEKIYVPLPSTSGEDAAPQPPLPGGQ